MLVSALVADGPPSRVLEQAIDGHIVLIVPDLVLDELDRVVTEKLGFSEEHALDVRGLLERASEPAVALAHAPPVTGDCADDAILACAVEARADILVTGDRKHLLPLGEHRGLRLLTPQALLAELLRTG